MHKTTCMVIQPLTVLLFVFVILELLQHALCAQTNFTKRGVTADDILNFRGAMLVKNGVETTCEFALIDNQAAFMAASCLDFNNGEVDSSTQYAIYFDQSMGNTPTNTAISANNIHIHPQYNPTTFANNVAIVEYNFTEQGNWTNYFAVYSSEWVSNVFVRRRLTSANSQIWREPFVNSYNNAGKLCSARSPLYSQNTYDMRCNQIQTNNSWNNTCPMPYGTVYGALTESLAIAGLYSHSYMFGQNFAVVLEGCTFLQCSCTTSSGASQLLAVRSTNLSRIQADMRA
ncbi:hypothetical protein BX070DRAFT_257139 [Coemansia spiralis]|nr:hypothetical protein BX070DRAFT_257139 [Coemansia spiralis]